MEQIYDSELFTYNANNSLKKINELMINTTTKKLEFYKELFGVEKLPKIIFNCYDDVELYRSDYFKRYNKIAPLYSGGHFDGLTSNCVIDLNKLDNPNYINWFIYSNSHEAFHMLYQYFIWGKDGERIVWFDEGLAQYFSGEINLTDETIYNMFNLFKESFIPIDNFNERQQGNDSIPDNLIFKRKNVFEGYKASFLCICYLVETQGLDYIKSILSNYDEIKKVGNTILNEMLDYYNKKYEKSKSIS